MLIPNEAFDVDLSHLDLSAAEKAAEEKRDGGGEVLAEGNGDNDCGDACKI